MMKRTIRRLSGAGAAIFLGGGSLHALAEMVPAEQPQATVVLGQLELQGSSTENPDGSFHLAGAQQGGSFNGGPSWSVQWDLTVNEDPFIIGSLTLTNLAAETRAFNLALSLSVAPFSSSIFGGSVNATVFDQGGNGSATLAPNLLRSPAIYRGTIDGVEVLPLFAATMTCGGSGPGCSSSMGFEDGLPGLTNPGPGVQSAIGTLLSFTLSGGDRVTFTTNFTVEPPSTVPLPAAAPLLLIGLGALGAARRRWTRKPK